MPCWMAFRASFSATIAFPSSSSPGRPTTVMFLHYVCCIELAVEVNENGEHTLTDISRMAQCANATAKCGFMGPFPSWAAAEAWPTTSKKWSKPPPRVARDRDQAARKSLIAFGPVVSDSWWKFVFGVAPNPDSHSIMRRGQAAARQGLGPAFTKHRPAAWRSAQRPSRPRTAWPPFPRWAARIGS